jgi:hypothetical protein
MLTLKPWLDSLTIKTTNLRDQRFDLSYVNPDPTIGDFGWAQREFVEEIERQYNSGQPVRIITLKARQLGISTVTEAVLFLWAFLHPGTNGAVIAHSDGQAQALFEKTKKYWETWPHKALFTEKYKTRRQLQWLETESNLRVVTANRVDALRGSTIHALHASELGFWDDAETLWNGLEPSIPSRHGTFVCLESTANGVGNWFHDEWQAAENGDSAFTPMFFPWYRHPAARIFNTHLTTIDLGADERGLLALMRGRGDISEEEAFASLAFRRVEIRKKGEEWFHQEMPTTPDEAFITSGNPIFNPAAVRECYEPRTGARGRLYRTGRGDVVFEQDPSGPFTLFKQPHPDRNPARYFIGGDPARQDSVLSDPACIQVIHRVTMEQVAIYHARTDPVQLVRQMILVGDFFGHAMLCPEVEGGGLATIGALIESGYGNIWAWKKADRTTRSSNTFGWSSNWNTKRQAISQMQDLINERVLVIHDRRTFNELLQFVQHDDGAIGNEGRSGHDDTVTALAIAVTASMMEGLFDPRERLSHRLDVYSSEFDRADLDAIVDRYNMQTG